MSTGSRVESKPVVDWFLILSSAAMGGVIWFVLASTRVERTMGPAQKIYYIHPQAATSAYLAIAIMVVMSVMYLWKRDDSWDRLAEASAEVAIMFCTVVLLTGPIWARTSWGVWWAWELRITLTLFLWFLLVGYMVMRSIIDDPSMRARYSAVLAVLAALLVPFIHLSVKMSGFLHPPPMMLTTGNEDGAPMEPEMARAFMVSMVVCAIFCVALIRSRGRLAARRDELTAIEEAA